MIVQFGYELQLPLYPHDINTLPSTVKPSLHVIIAESPKCVPSGISASPFSSEGIPQSAYRDKLNDCFTSDYTSDILYSSIR
jgi:hypothetical protein